MPVLILTFYILYIDESDFTPASKNITFSPEQQQVMCVDIPIIDDDVFDPRESFLVQLLPFDVNVTIVNGTLSEMEVFIIDNDGRITIAIQIV